MVKRCCPTCASEADSGECHTCNPDRWLALKRGQNYFKITSKTSNWKEFEYRCLEIWKPQNVTIRFTELNSTVRIYNVLEHGHYGEMKIPEGFQVTILEEFRAHIANGLFSR
jgi:hypothetical protein